MGMSNGNIYADNIVLCRKIRDSFTDKANVRICNSDCVKHAESYISSACAVIENNCSNPETVKGLGCFCHKAVASHCVRCCAEIIGKNRSLGITEMPFCTCRRSVKEIRHSLVEIAVAVKIKVGIIMDNGSFRNNKAESLTDNIDERIAQKIDNLGKQLHENRLGTR